MTLLFPTLGQKPLPYIYTNTVIILTAEKPLLISLQFLIRFTYTPLDSQFAFTCLGSFLRKLPSTNKWMEKDCLFNGVCIFPVEPSFPHKALTTAAANISCFPHTSIHCQSHFKTPKMTIDSRLIITAMQPQIHKLLPSNTKLKNKYMNNSNCACYKTQSLRFSLFGILI